VTVAAAGAVAESPELRTALAECERITRTQARNFYYGLKLTPEPQRSAMFVIYAWMRAADDLADATGFESEERIRRIAAFREATDRALEGRAVDGAPGAAAEVWQGLSWVASRHSLSARDFHDMLDGQLSDVGEATYEDWDSLRAFCYRVASTVGLVCIRVWGYTGEEAPGLAVDRGIAFQLTNILRDFREDYDMGRVYLPADEMRRMELTARDLRDWSKPDLCAEFIRAQCARAEQYYRRSQPLDRLVTPSCRPTLWAMTEIYHGLLERIAARPHLVARDQRVRLSGWRKAWIALRARRMAREASA
jgi:15-cis-phytoene synthase